MYPSNVYHHDFFQSSETGRSLAVVAVASCGSPKKRDQVRSLTRVHTRQTFTWLIDRGSVLGEFTHFRDYSYR